MVVPKLGIYGRFRQNGSCRLADRHAVCGNDIAERVFCDGVFRIFFGSIQRNETNLCNAVNLVFIVLIKAFVAAGAQFGHAVLHGNVKDFRFTVEFLLAQILLNRHKRENRHGKQHDDDGHDDQKLGHGKAGFSLSSIFQTLPIP